MNEIRIVENDVVFSVDEVTATIENAALIEDNKRLQAENVKLREELDCCLKLAPKCDECEAMLDCWECLRADSSQKERKRLDYENEKLRELVADMWEYIYIGTTQDGQSLHDRTRELGVDV